jgi:hypothetical protein
MVDSSDIEVSERTAECEADGVRDAELAFEREMDAEEALVFCVTQQDARGIRGNDRAAHATAFIDRLIALVRSECVVR